MMDTSCQFWWKPCQKENLCNYVGVSELTFFHFFSVEEKYSRTR